MEKQNPRSCSRVLPLFMMLSCILIITSCSKDSTIENTSPVVEETTTSTTNNLTTTSTTFTTLKPSHIVVAVMENHSLSHIIGNSQAPYINSLVKDAHTAYMNQSFAVTHPSQPNYIALFSGSTQGITSDNMPTNAPWSSANLGVNLIGRGYSFAGYSEDLPSAGFTGATYHYYARKHNPWVDWQGTGYNRLSASTNQPLTDFPTNFTKLPTVSFVIPNLNNDMHNSTVSQGDTWLKYHLNNYIQWAKTNNSIFILTFDEDDFSQSNQITTLLIGANIKGGSYSTKINHYNVLRTIEQLYGTSYAGASAGVSAIKGIWLK
ncbi:MAG TPA: alkaline phosphatase family protein [Flavisolibacter sp.]|nr:alkaline phosphatase family protein [Flavisolibacter sp.]